MGSLPRLDRSRIVNAARKLLLLGPRGWWLLVQAQVALLRARSFVRGQPRGRLVRALGQSAASEDAADPEDRERVEAIGLAVDRVARFGLGRPLCLVQSVALQKMLARHGISGSSIRVGVRMKGGRFEAHAWVEWHGIVVGEDAEFVGEFEPFDELDSGEVAVSWSRSSRPS